MLRLRPAYGRDYTSKAAVLRDWVANKDFLITSGRWQGKPTNKSSAIAMGETQIQVRYGKLRKIAVFNADAKAPAKKAPAKKAARKKAPAKKKAPSRLFKGALRSGLVLRLDSIMIPLGPLRAGEDYRISLVKDPFFGPSVAFFRPAGQKELFRQPQSTIRALVQEGAFKKVYRSPSKTSHRGTLSSKLMSRPETPNLTRADEELLAFLVRDCCVGKKTNPTPAVVRKRVFAKLGLKQTSKVGKEAAKYINWVYNRMILMPRRMR